MVFAAASPQTFLSGRIYAAFMSTIPTFAVMALAMTLVIVAGEIDMCFPSTMALSGYVFSTVFLLTRNGFLAFLAAGLTGMAVGLVNGLLVVAVGVPSIIATIGTQFFWRGLIMVLSNGLAVSLVSTRETLTHDLFVGRLWGAVPAQALWCLAVAALLAAILNRHPFGDSLLFIGDNPDAARMMGIATGKARIGVFVLLGFFSAFSGVIDCLELSNWWPTQGEGYLLLVFAAVFIGGTSVFGGRGTLYGTLIGAVIIGIIEAGIVSAGLSGFWTRLVYGLIIVVSVSCYARMAKGNKGTGGR